jgi:transposase
LVSPLKRTWSPCGQTPIIRTSIQHHERINLLGALFVLPDGNNIKLTVKSYWHSLTGDEVIAFLKQILSTIPGPIVLVWDNHPIHKRQKVQDFLAAQDRLYVYHFPIAAPELNPVEFVWTQVSEYTAGTAPHNHDELQSNVFAGIARTRSSQKRLRACFLGTRLDWPV